MIWDLYQNCLVIVVGYRESGDTCILLYNLTSCESLYEQVACLTILLYIALMIDLKQTCSVSPEQYDAYIDGEKIGYLRLRHGYFSVEYKGELVYEGFPYGDGCFEDEEQEEYLDNAKKALWDKHNGHK